MDLKTVKVQSQAFDGQRTSMSWCCCCAQFCGWSETLHNHCQPQLQYLLYWLRLIHMYEASIRTSTRKSMCEPGRCKHKRKHTKKESISFSYDCACLALVHTYFFLCLCLHYTCGPALSVLNFIIKPGFGMLTIEPVKTASNRYVH